MRAEEPARERAPWVRRVQSVGTALATAVVLATPRGPARAAQQQELSAPDATPTTRTVGDARSPLTAFIGIPRNKKLLPPVFEQAPPPGSVIDLDKIVPKKMARRFTDRDFIFSESLTEKSDLEEELEDLETYKEQSKGSRALQTVATTGGALSLVYLSVKGLSNVERWIKMQELRDIQEEMDLTGTYISVDASDVDSAIDPTTGKNMTISRGKSSKAPSADGDDTPKQAPWLLRVLGLGDTVAADDDGFWEVAAPSQGTQPKPKGGGEGGADGGVDGGDGGDGGDGDEDDDDSSGIDTLDDLLG